MIVNGFSPKLAPLAGACLRPLGHLSVAALVAVKAPTTQAICRVKMRKRRESTNPELCGTPTFAAVNVRGTLAQNWHNGVPVLFPP